MILFPLTLLLLFTAALSAFGQEGLIPERRKPQFLSQGGYMVIPAPYSMPGIGEGMAIYGGVNNYIGYADFFGIHTMGDAEGTMVGLWDLHLIKEHLFVDLTRMEFQKVGFNSYASRGMGGGKDDFSVIETDRYRANMVDTVFSFYDRRLEVGMDFYEETFRPRRFLDPEGEVIQTISDPDEDYGNNYDYSILIDLSDDRQDPRRGVRGELIFTPKPKNGPDDPEYYTTSINLTGYLPLDGSDTWVFNYFHSDAHIQKKGEQDKAVLAEAYDCTYASCSQEVQNEIDNIYAHNTYGSARALGGTDRLRAYPGNRFQGAHSRAVGTEVRFNFLEGRKPVNLFLIKDLRTSVQLAFFHEIGTVADEESQLWKRYRTSTGAGVRFVMGSGFVYRFDYAVGDEGGEMTIFVTYPWEEL